MMAAIRKQGPEMAAQGRAVASQALASPRVKSSVTGFANGYAINAS